MVETLKITWGTAFLVFEVSSSNWKPIPPFYEQKSMHLGWSNFNTHNNYSIYTEDAGLYSRISTTNGPANLRLESRTQNPIKMILLTP